MNMNININILILAGGLGTRMKSNLPKVMHKICGKPIVEYIVDTSIQLNPERIILLIGNGSEIVKKHFTENYKNENIYFAHQEKQLGTGDAVKSAEKMLQSNTNIIILSGDVPLIKKETLEKLVNMHNENNNTITLLSMFLDNPFGYGRIVKENNNVKAIVEEKDANEEVKKIKEVNAGIYIMKSDFLKEYVYKLNNNNAQKEFYITDLIKLASNDNKQVESILIENEKEVMGINNRYQLAFIENIILRQIKEKFMLNGVTMENAETIYIDYNVEIESDVIIESNVTLKGNSKIKKGSIIKAGTYIENAIIQENTEIKPNSVIIE